MERFDAWEYVFDTCRERNKPMRIQIGDEQWKVFPSGRAEPLNKAAIKAGIAEGYLKMEKGKVVHV